MKNFFCAIALMLAACLVVLAGCSGGSGSGSSSPTADDNSQITDNSSQVVDSLAALEQSALAGDISEEEFADQLQEILAAVDAETDGSQNLEDYLEADVVGGDVNAMLQSPAPAHAAKSFTDTMAKIKASETWLMLTTFGETVAKSFVVEPVAILTDLAQPEVFISIASVLTRTHVYDALFSGEIDALTATEISNKIQNNPFDAQRDLLEAKGETIPDWLEPMNDVCLNPSDCDADYGTRIYSGSFSGNMTETALGCVWLHALSGTVEVVVTGSGTLADPYEGTYDVSGNIVTTLQSGSECDPGGSASIDDFDGTVSGTNGKLNAEGQGTIGSASFISTLSNATVSSSATTGSFLFDLDVDNTINQTVTLNR